jgi:sugar phosphate isomerase/epimerase
LKLGIDSYSFHRFFGEVYPGLETLPDHRWTVWDFLDVAGQLGAEAVSLESCFLPVGDRELSRALAKHLDDHGLERIWAWGHPRGLESGNAPEQLDAGIASLSDAAAVGAKVMRICAGGRGTRWGTWAQQREVLLPMLARFTREAEALDVTLALENHIDLYADEMLDLVESVGSEHFGICFDTANNLRLYEDPHEVARKLADHVRATHVKDVRAAGGDPETIGFWPSVPVGQGLLKMPMILEALRDSGYRGVLAIEIDYLAAGYGDERQAVAQSLQYLQELRTALNIPS